MAFDQHRHSRRVAADLGLLLKAPNKQSVNRLFQRVFVTRQAGVAPAGFGGDLGLTAEEAPRLYAAMREVVQTALYANAADRIVDEGVALDERLTGLISQILTANLPAWRQASLDQTVSLPKLVDVDWRVDVATSSEQVTRMAVPTVIVDLQVEDQPTQVAHVPAVQNVTFELSKEALQTLLDGLGRIRDQLSAVQ